MLCVGLGVAFGQFILNRKLKPRMNANFQRAMEIGRLTLGVSASGSIIHSFSDLHSRSFIVSATICVGQGSGNAHVSTSNPLLSQRVPALAQTNPKSSAFLSGRRSRDRSPFIKIHRKEGQRSDILPKCHLFDPLEGRFDQLHCVPSEVCYPGGLPA
jgi:hypothetical protein